jgi:Holliday junction resolvasome RuvABC DNA-binding subunit
MPQAGAKAESALSPAMTPMRAKAESALRIMGFAAKEVKLALARIPKDSNASLEQIVRQGLAELAETRPSFRRRERGRELRRSARFGTLS